MMLSLNSVIKQPANFFLKSNLSVFPKCLPGNPLNRKSLLGSTSSSSLQCGNSVKPLSTLQCINLPSILENKILKNRNELVQPNRGYAMRLELSEYGLIWKRPEYIPSWKPEKSGDLAPFEELDKTKPILAIMPAANELIKSDERAQRILSLEFSSDNQILEMAKYRMKRRIQQHQFDDDSLEVKIAMMTVEIRFIQDFLTKTKKPRKKTTRRRVQCQEMIDRRKRKLKHLRRLDYKKFEWLIEEVQLMYRPFPRYCRWITRKGSLRKLVRMHCNRLRTEKLNKYKLELETLKEPFLMEKRETLKWIKETEEKLGLPPSVQDLEENDVKLIKS